MNIRFRRLAALTLSILLALTLLTTGHAQSYSSLVEDVLDRFASNDARCESAPQQSVNGVYRCEELLAITGTYDAYIRARTARRSSGWSIPTSSSGRCKGQTG